MQPDKKLLTYLNQYGVGYYQSIDDILKEMFSGEDYSDFSKATGGTRIWRFLKDLKRHEFIEYDVLNHDGQHLIKAAIQPKGIDYLFSTEKPQPNFYIEGSGNQIINQSPSSSFFDDKSQRASTIRKGPTKISTILSNWKLVMGIILSLIAVLTALKSFYKSPSSDKLPNDTTIMKSMSDTTVKKDFSPLLVFFPAFYAIVGVLYGSCADAAPTTEFGEDWKSRVFFTSVSLVGLAHCLRLNANDGVSLKDTSQLKRHLKYWTLLENLGAWK